MCNAIGGRFVADGIGIHGAGHARDMRIVAARKRRSRHFLNNQRHLFAASIVARGAHIGQAVGIIHRSIHTAHCVFEEGQAALLIGHRRNHIGGEDAGEGFQFGVFQK